MYPGRYSWEFLVGVCRPVFQILDLFQTKKCHFPDPFSDQTSKIHTRFQTWPLGRNYVIITYPLFKSISNSHISLSFLLIWNWNDRYVHTLRSSQPDSTPKWAKCIPVFRPKRRKNPTRWGGTYRYSLFMGVLPPNNAYLKLFLFLK